MSLPLLPTDLHDAAVDQFAFEPLRGRLTLSLWIEPANGLYVRRKQLLLSGISNGKEVERLQQQIDQIKRKSKKSALWYRLDEFDYCDPLASKKTELAIRLAIDHLPVLIIHCKKITVQELT
jgi:hypothetical protein